MNAIHEYISDATLHNIVIFAGAAIIGMVFAYYRRWAWLDQKILFRTYIVGDRQAMGRAVTTLVLLCGATGSLDFLTAMSDMQVFIAGAGIGFMVPATVDMERDDKRLIGSQQDKKKK